MVSFRSGALVSVLFMIAIWAFALPAYASAENNELKSSALIVKMEGSGQAFVRRKSRQQLTAAIGMSVYAGDSITTDAGTAVELLFPEGSLIRVGLNSEYKIASAEKKKGFISWIFELTKGSMRGLIEKSGDKANVRVRVNTPAGTMGVRGTEFLLEHEEKSGITKLFTLHGLVEFGAQSCVRGKSCVEVGAQKMSFIKRGDKFPTEPRGFGVDELLRGVQKPGEANGGVAEGSQESKEARNRLALRVGVERAEQMRPQIEKIDGEQLAKLVKEAEDKLQAVQDFFMGRDERLRKEMHAAKVAGTFDAHMQLADKFTALAKGEALEPGAATGLRESRKFALAEAILKNGEKSASGMDEKNRLTIKPLAGGTLKSATRAATPEYGLWTTAEIKKAKAALSEAKVALVKNQEEVAARLAAVEEMRTKKPCSLICDTANVVGTATPDPQTVTSAVVSTTESVDPRIQPLERIGLTNYCSWSGSGYTDVCELLAREQEKAINDEKAGISDLANTDGADIIRDGDRCYRYQSNCTLVSGTTSGSCDLTSGKKCSPNEPSRTTGTYSCKQEKVQVTCPRLESISR